MLSLTEKLTQLLRKTNITPVLVLSIDGVSTVYSSSLVGAASESVLISLDGTTTDISQQLSPDRSAISSVSSMKINLIDKDGEITTLITPGAVVTDILGRRARVYLGLDGASYPTDFAVIFRGVVDDIVSEQGMIGINLGHPDQKKRNTIYEKAETSLIGGHNNSTTTIFVSDTSKFLVGVTGPDGLVDSSFLSYIRIDDEIIQYAGKTSLTFTGCTRGALNTTAASHSDDAEVTSFYRLTGNGVDLALKLMLSGWFGPFESDVDVTNFVRTSGTTDVANSMYFSGVDLQQRYGVNEGDYITTTGASNGANNVTLKQISTLVVENGSTYIVVSGVTFVSEIGTAAVVDFRSQYDTLPAGLKMHGDEVDVFRHEFWYTRYLSSFDLDFYLKDTIEGKEFIEKQIYLPMSAFSLPRQSRASMGVTAGPLPIDTITILSAENCTNPDKIKLRRQMGRNFYNTIVYRFEQDVLEDKYLFGYVLTDTDSKAQIQVGNKSMIIDSDGMRRSLSGSAIAALAAERLLTRYKYAAEYIEDFQVLFSTGFSIETGDIVLLDGSELNLSDIGNGTRNFVPRFMEVQNKKLNIKNGIVSLSLIDTNLAVGEKYGLISPASVIASGTSTTQFTIQSSYSSAYGTNEWRKWQRYIGCGVKVRNSDYSTSSTSFITAVSSSNVVTVSPALSFTPSAGYVMELSAYNNQNATIKAIYVFMRDTAPFDDGEQLYKMQ